MEFGSQDPMYMAGGLVACHSALEGSDTDDPNPILTNSGFDWKTTSQRLK